MMRFFLTYLKLTLGKLCRRFWLLAGLALACLLLPLGAGRGAAYLLSRSTASVGRLTLAVTAPAGDNTPEQLAGAMAGMEDIAAYCQVVPMEEPEALAALERGELTAVLALPENFIHGVMYGSNPDLRLIVSGERPLESLLLLWVGQGGCDILSAAQAGIYAVLDLYREVQPESPPYQKVLTDINLRYMTITLNRADFFVESQISATGTLPVVPHYALSLLAYFGLAAAPLLMELYSGGWVRSQNRLRAVGRSCAAGFWSAAAASTAVWLVLLVPGVLAAAASAHLRLSPGPLAAGAVVMAAFCALFGALCCLISGSAAGCGALSFAAALAGLVLAGGVVPPVLLPRGVQALSPFSPVTWLRQLAAWSMGYQVPGTTWLCVGVTLAGMAGISLVLYRKQTQGEENGL